MITVAAESLNRTFPPSFRLRALTIALGRYMAYFFPTETWTVRLRANRQVIDGKVRLFNLPQAVHTALLRVSRSGLANRALAVPDPGSFVKR